MSYSMVGGNSPEEQRQRQLQSALDSIKGTGRTAMSLRAGLMREGMQNDLGYAGLTQRDDQFQQDLGLRQQQLAQQQNQFDASQKQTYKLSTMPIGTTPATKPVGEMPTTTLQAAQPTTTVPTSSVYRSGSAFSDNPYERRKDGGVVGHVTEDDGEDKVPVMAREGEYFLNPETVAHIGGGDYSKGLRSLNALVREATGKEPGGAPVGKSGLRGYANSGVVEEPLLRRAMPLTYDMSTSTGAAAKQAFDQGEYGSAAGHIARGTLGNVAAVPLDLANSAYKGVVMGGRALEGLVRGAGNFAKTLATGETVAAAEPSKPIGVPTPAAVQNEAAPVVQPTQGGLRAAEAKVLDQSARGAGISAPPGATSPQQAAGPASETADDVYARHKAADVYRTAWQGRAPQGLRGADSDALTLYNAEQRTRGTGIQAKRGANGVMEFSDGGPRMNQYVGADNQPTNDWRNTEQYQSAMARSGEGRIPIEAQKMRQLEEKGLREYQLQRDELNERTRQWNEGRGLREAETAYKNAQARGAGADKLPKAGTIANEVAEAWATTDGKTDKDQALRVRSQIGKMVMPNGMPFAEYERHDPEGAYAYVENEIRPLMLINKALERGQGKRLPLTEVADPKIQGAKFGDYGPGFWDKIMGNDGILTKNGMAMLSDIPDEEREIVNSYLSRLAQQRKAQQ